MSDSNWFRLVLVGAVVVGAIIRFSYIMNFPSISPTVISGDGVEYYFGAIRLAHGQGYTSTGFLGEAGKPEAHHPPGWVSVLAVVSALGHDDVTSHQIFSALIGLCVIVIIGLIGRRVFGPESGAIAACIAAIYPGFWVLEAQVLAEPLTLLLVGLTIRALYRFNEKTCLPRALEVGFFVGLAALVRSEQLAFLILLPVILWQASDIDLRQRVLFGLAAVGCTVLVLSPWAIYNSSRFVEPVFLSSNSGTALLVGNCNLTYEGESKGFWNRGCVTKHVKMDDIVEDKSVMDSLARERAIEQIQGNLDKLPSTIAARFGRALGVYRPTHTVEEVAKWQGIKTWPIWAWIGMFWFLLPFAIGGAFAAVREKVYILPLVVPVLVSLGVITLFFGEPRYHTIADLSFTVLAGYGAMKFLRLFNKNKEPLLSAS